MLTKRLFQTFLEVRAKRRALASAKSRRMRRLGYSLIEILLGAALLAAFVVKIYNMYTSTAAADRYMDFISEVGQINAAVHETFINAPDYTNLDTATIAGVIPRKYVKTGGIMVTPYKSLITSLPTTDKNGFIISAAGVPAEDCIKAASGDMGRGLTGIAINGASAIDLSVAGVNGNIPGITTACKGVTATTTTIAWTFQN